MGRAEQAHHLAYLRLHPPVGDLVNFSQARIVTAVLNAAFGSKGRAKAGDFIMDFMAKPKARSPQDTKVLMQGWVAAANAAAKAGK